MPTFNHAAYVTFIIPTYIATGFSLKAGQVVQCALPYMHKKVLLLKHVFSMAILLYCAGTMFFFVEVLALFSLFH